MSRQHFPPKLCWIFAALFLLCLPATRAQTTGTIVGHLAVVIEINPAVYGPGATASNVQQRRPFFPQYYGSIGDLHSDANSNYHSLQANVQKRFSRGYTLQLAYTWSKSIDHGSKRFAPWEQERFGAFEFRGEAYSLLNFVNLGQPTNNMASPAHGRILSAGSARIFQMGSRYDF